jgi:tetratricopeptide (TPR) repeat protein
MRAGSRGLQRAAALVLAATSLAGAVLVTGNALARQTLTFPGESESDTGGAVPVVPDGRSLDSQQPPGGFDSDTVDALVRAHARYVEAGDGERALQSAQLLRELHEARYGADAREVLPWVKVHAYAYKRVGRLEEAQGAFERAVLLTERYEGPFSYSLVELLMSQGQMLYELGRREQAESALLRAKFITHRRLGINNLEQVPVVRALTAFYLRTFSGEKAEREQQFLLRIYERNYGETPALVDGLYGHAGYYMSIGDYQSALPVYRRALEILEEAYGEDDLRLVPPLQGIASAHIKRDSRRGEGERALERIVSLYDQSGFADVYDHALSLRDLGDWHMRTSDSNSALESYARAWRLLAQSDGGIQRARELLGTPVELDYVSPPNVYDSHEDRSFLSAERYLETRFTVQADGRLTDVVVVGGNAERRTEFDNLRALRAARFRPAFEDGEPVSVTMTWRQYHTD